MVGLESRAAVEALTETTAPVAVLEHRPLPSRAAVLVLSIVGGALPLVLAHHFGAWNVPRNDDWSYLLSAFRLADGHGLNGNGWASMNLVGQLILSLPVVWVFGHRIAALQVEVAELGVLGLTAVYDLAKSVSTDRRALFVAVMVAVGPMWASLSASYMTDVPAFALAMMCLAVGVRAIGPERLRRLLFAAAVLVGFLGFAVREYAIVAPLAVILGALWSSMRWRRPTTGLLVSLFGLIVSATALLAWRRGLPGFMDLTVSRPSFASLRDGVHAGAQSAVLLGLLVSPAVLLAGPRRLVSASFDRAPRVSTVVGAMTGVGLGAELLRQRSSAQFLGIGNYVLPNGTLGTATLPGDRPDLVARPLLAVLGVVGAVTVAVLAIAAVPPILNALHRVRRRRFTGPSSPALAIVSLAAVGYGCACLLPPIFGLADFDRYLLPLIPLVGVLVLRGRSPRETKTGTPAVIAGLALAALATFGLVYAANSASWDGAKWNVAEQAAKIAGGANHVQGGFEWTNYHAGEAMYLTPRVKAPEFCIVLRAQRQPPAAGIPTARVWGPTGTQTWIVSHRRNACSSRAHP